MAETPEERVKRLSQELGIGVEELPSNEALMSPPPQTPQEPSLWDQARQKPVGTFVRPALEAAGALAGGVLGTPLGPAAQFGGGALGFAGGSALGDAAEVLAGERPGPKTVPDVLGRTVGHLKEGGIFEAGGRVIGKGAEWVASGLKSMIRGIASGQMKPITPEQQVIADTAKEMGVQLRPAEITGSQTGAQIEQSARRSILGRGKFQKLDTKNATDLVNFYDTYAERVFGKQESPEELGRLIQDAVHGRVIPDVQAVNRGLYQTLAQRTGDTPIVKTGNVAPQAQALREAFDPKIFPKSNEIANKIYETLTDRGPTTGLKVSRADVETRPDVHGPLTGQPSDLRTGLGTPNYSDKGFVIPGETKLQGSVSGMEGRRPQLNIKLESEAQRVPKTLTFMQAHDARSALLDLTRTGELLSSREKAVASRLAGALDDAMETAAKGFDAQHGTTVMHDWRIANASMASSHELFDSAVIRKAMSASPEDVVKVAFNKGALTETSRVLSALSNDTKGLKSFRQAAFRELLTRSTSDGVLDPKKMLNAAYGRTGVGEEVMQRTFGEHAAEIKKFIHTASRMNLTTALPAVPGTTHPGVNFLEQGMMIAAPSVATGLASAGYAGAGVGTIAGTSLYFLSMDQISRLVNSPTGLKLLNRYMGLAPRSHEAARVGGLLFNELDKINDD